MTDQPSVEEARAQLVSAVAAYRVAKHPSPAELHAAITLFSAAVRRDTLREVREAVRRLRPDADQRADLWYDGYDGAIDDTIIALDRLEARE